MKKEQEFVTFEGGKIVPGQKTKSWLVNDRDGVATGTICWKAQWRCYVFWPHRVEVFDAKCLRKIATFLDIETRLHRQGWKKRRIKR